MPNLARLPGDLFVDAAVTLEEQSDGSRLFRSSLSLPTYARCSGEWLEQWARQTPHAVYLAARQGQGGWEEITYQQARDSVYRIATWLLAQNLSPERPVLVLSDNGIEHALLMLACLHIGVPISAVSTGNSLQSKDHARLKANIELLRPGVIFADRIERFMPAIQAVAHLHDGVVVAGSNSLLQSGTLPFCVLESTQAEPALVYAVFKSLTPDTIAKFLFTSGSVGMPKAVITTQRMMCSNVEAKSVIWPFLNEQKPVIVDWLPWSHVFGGNHNFNIVLRFGGSLYIDEGKPLPAQLHKTVKNLTDVSPNIYFSVPRAFDMLVPLLRDDAVFRKSFFSRLQIIFYAGAALPQSVWEDLERLAVQELGHPMVMLSSWGATETGPTATDCHFQVARSGVIGVPLPGTTLKLLTVADKLEVRVKGPNVFPGYWKQPALSASAFDADGFYLIGDAVEFLDVTKPELGLLFDGRVAEDFKLLTGTWVHVGAIRVAAITALSPVAQDVVVTGHDRDDIGFLVFPNIPECRRIAGLTEDVAVEDVLTHSAVRDHVRVGLLGLKAKGGGSSTYATRALLEAAPPSTEASELTDKGYVNQRAVLSNRADSVKRLYASTTDSHVISINLS
ncbi:MAG: feruloyl-CoA synthase [Rhodoferax sp.]|nr:feruloyl-CoA synthase [Rhodoferax sp.]